MMKSKLILTALALATITSPLHARTWTSADGKNNFNGDYVSSTDTTLTVIKNGRKRTFKLDLISEADRSWIKEQKTKALQPAAENKEPGKIATQLEKCLTKFNGKRYARYELEKKPEYFLIYFSASW